MSGDYSHIHSVTFPWVLKLNPDPGKWRTPLHKRRAKSTAVPPFKHKHISALIRLENVHKFARAICIHKS